MRKKWDTIGKQQTLQSRMRAKPRTISYHEGERASCGCKKVSVVNRTRNVNPPFANAASKWAQLSPMSRKPMKTNAPCTDLRSHPLQSKESKIERQRSNLRPHKKNLNCAWRCELWQCLCGSASCQEQTCLKPCQQEHT